MMDLSRKSTSICDFLGLFTSQVSLLRAGLWSWEPGACVSGNDSDSLAAFKPHLPIKMI